MYSDRLMQSMLQSMGMGITVPGPLFESPFGPHPSQHIPANDPISAMMPHGFMNPMSMMMMDPFQSMQQAMSMATNGSNGQISYCSSSVTSYTTDEHGRPQVYQQSREVKSGPDGIKETKSAIRDSRTGHQELAIGRHIHDKAHIKKKSKNAYTGDEEQVEDLVNIDESELPSFEDNWKNKTSRFVPTSYNQLHYGPHTGSSRNDSRLAIASSAQEDRNPPTSHRASSHPSCSTQIPNPVKSVIKAIKKKKKSKEPKV